uniref:Late blight resistance protein n=1 Tax=Solanum tuberosum TaxID=4113 RepID=M1D8A4_SOLTU
MDSIIEDRVVRRDGCMDGYVPHGSRTERQRVVVVEIRLGCKEYPYSIPLACVTSPDLCEIFFSSCPRLLVEFCEVSAELRKPGQGFAWGHQWFSSAGQVQGVGSGRDIIVRSKIVDRYLNDKLMGKGSPKEYTYVKAIENFSKKVVNYPRNLRKTVLGLGEKERAVGHGDGGILQTLDQFHRSASGKAGNEIKNPVHLLGAQVLEWVPARPDGLDRDKLVLEPRLPVSPYKSKM